MSEKSQPIEESALNDFQVHAQPIHPVMPLSQGSFRSWEEILGNTKLKTALRAFASRPHRPGNHILVSGSNRSCKTMAANFAIQAKFCCNPDHLLNPCGTCESCRRWLTGPFYRNGRYSNGAEQFEYQGVDCTNPKTFNEETVLGPRGPSWPLVLFLDEVASPAFGPIIPKLFKPMMELPINVIACAVRIKAIRDPKTKQIKPGVPPDFTFRFPIIEKTTTVPMAEFVPWLKQQCANRSLPFDNEATLELIALKSFGIPGQALRPLQKAVFLGVPLTKSFIEDFHWDAP